MPCEGAECVRDPSLKYAMYAYKLMRVRAGMMCAHCSSLVCNTSNLCCSVLQASLLQMCEAGSQGTEAAISRSRLLRLDVCGERRDHAVKLRSWHAGAHAGPGEVPRRTRPAVLHQVHGLVLSIAHCLNIELLCHCGLLAVKGDSRRFGLTCKANLRVELVRERSFDDLPLRAGRINASSVYVIAFSRNRMHDGPATHSLESSAHAHRGPAGHGQSRARHPCQACVPACSDATPHQAIISPAVTVVPGCSDSLKPSPSFCEGGMPGLCLTVPL